MVETLNYKALLYLLFMVAVWVTCMVLLVKGAGNWLLIIFIPALVIGWHTNTYFGRLYRLGRAMVLAAGLGLIVQLGAAYHANFEERRPITAITCGSSMENDGWGKKWLTLHTSAGDYYLEGGTYIDSKGQHFLGEAPQVNRFFAEGGRYRLTTHGSDFFGSKYVTGATRLRGTGLCK